MSFKSPLRDVGRYVLARASNIHLAVLFALTVFCLPRTPASAQNLPVNGQAYVVRFTPGVAASLDGAPVALRQAITVHLNHVTIERALREVTGRADISISYSRSVVPLGRRVSVDVKDGSVVDALSQVLNGAGVELWVSKAGRMVLVPSANPDATVASSAVADAIVTGKITSTGGAPIAGATVSIASLNVNAVTDAAGVYKLTVPSANVAARQETLSVTRIGFRPASVSFALHDGTVTVNVILTEVAVSLNQVVVTGTAGNQERRAQGAVVATVDAAAITQTAPVNNVMELLQSREPGVSISDVNGAVGGTSLIRLRGVASISLSDEPLVFVDGVRINSGNFSTDGMKNISFLNDLNPDNIQSIEIVKGPAAATLYGADASAGVIQIITKKGRAGQPFSQRVSLEYDQYHPNFTPLTNYATCSAGLVDPSSPFAVCHGLAAGTVITDNPLERDDVINDASGSALGWQGSGGGEKYGYFLSYGQDHQAGILPGNRLKRRSVQANFRVLPSSTLTIDANFGLSHMLTDQTPQSDSFGYLINQGGSPLTLGTPVNGYLTPGTSTTAVANVSDRFIDNRVLPNVTATYNPVSWFTNRLTLGVDASNVNRRLFYPRNDSSFYSGILDRTGTAAVGNLGYVEEDRVDRKIYTLDYLGNIHHALGESGAWVADLSFGTQLISNEFDQLAAAGSGFLTNSTNTISAAATVVKPDGLRNTQRYLGYLGQLQLGYRNKLFLQYGARFDRNSAFGNPSETFFLPKYSLSYVVSDESFWQRHLPFINTLRLRAAYGTTGRAPTPGAALTTYSSRQILNRQGTDAIAGVGLDNPGNPDLKAERGTEFEGGFDAGFLNDRIGAEVTYFNKETKDLLLQRPIPPSLGFSDNPFVNLGSVVNRGLEIAVHANIISTENVGLVGRFTMSTLHNEVTSLGGTQKINYGGFGSSQVVDVGVPIGEYITQRVTSVDVANNRAIVTDTAVYFGSPYPKREGTFSGDLTLFKVLRVNALFEYKNGLTRENFDRVLRDRALGNSERGQPGSQAALPSEERLRLYGPYFDSAGNPVSPLNVVEDYLEDGSFVRFRELSVTLTLPTRFANSLRTRDASLTFGARNLKLWTDYSGADTETMLLVPTNGLYQNSELFSLPQPQRFYLRLNLGF